MKHARSLALAAALLATTAYALPPHDGPPSHDIEKLAILLELDDAQKAEVQRILEEARGKMKATRAQLSESETPPPREEIKEAHERSRQDVLTQLQSVLTADQLRKFEVLTDHPRGHH